MKNASKKENLDLVKEHISIAEDIIIEEAKNSSGESRKSLENAVFSLEKAESEIDDSV